MLIISTKKAYRKFLLKYISWFVLAAYMLVIFLLSSQNDYKSENLSTAIAQKIRPYVVSLYFQQRGQTISVSKLNYKIRKLTHFTEYFFLAVFLFLTFTLSKRGYNKKLALTLLICIIYAVFDEMHQIFVPGRGPGVRDVLIDTFGAATAVFILYFGRKVIICFNENRI